MKRFLLLAVGLFITQLSFSQDTTVVQTLRWADNFRSDTFHFPDDSNQSWRKIYLVYNMRCRNGTAGGCGEWDYSCNTFITDPTRTDSTRQTFPDYIISGFSGNSFNYSTAPTYTYYQFLQHQTAFAGGTAEEYTLGQGAASFPLAGAPGNHKTQLLFTASELSAAGLSAGNIHGLKLAVSQAGAELGFFNIRLKSTTKSALSAADPDLSDFTEVYFRSTPFSSPGALAFPFYQPFYWDGVSNLLVEWSYNAANADAAALLATDTGFDASLLNDQPDQSLNFGSGSYVDIPTATLSGVSTEITVTLWSFGNANVLPVNSTIFEGNNAAGARAINVHLPWSNGSVYWDCGGGNGNYDRIEKAADPSMFEGRWNHWAFTKNITTGVMKIYLNGVLWHSGTGKTIPIDFKSLVVGGSADHSLSYFGKIDAFQVWDKELDEATIAAWMRKPITPAHPNYANLRADYHFDEGAGTTTLDASPATATAKIHLPNWLPTRGVDLYKNFDPATARPNTTFLQGNLSIDDTTVPVLDSVLNAQQQVLHYGVSGTDLVVLDTLFYYPAGPMAVLDPATDTVLTYIQSAVEGTIQVQTLNYYLKRPARFELLSLVTPYGNGLNLGTTGKTFTFDITDYAPILQGNKVLSVEFGGEWQEDLDLKFVFVKGVPSKPVQNIQNIWPQARGWYQDILDDRIFEPRTLPLSNTAKFFKIRSAVTGHGQNGEFVPRQHYLNVDGGGQEFQYDVWKYCGKNPIYPQGGTWIFDRAGWCPGMATDVHEFNFFAQAGATISLDYGLNGEVLSDANYLVSNQLVSYGNYSHALDASLEAIMRPNNRQVEYARINPACNTPMVLVRNNGSTPINSILFEYRVPGGGAETYTWTGQIPADESLEITLPLLSAAFWTTSEAVKQFEVKIAQVNNQQDEDPDNNIAGSTFTPAPAYSFPNPLRIRTNTNNHGEEYSYTIKDAAGNVVLSRNEMLSNTSYVDLVDLPNGCYTLDFKDTGNDGLSFWFFPENGAGSVNLARELPNGSLVSVKSFNPDFGGGVQFDFIIAQTVATSEIEDAALISVYPNPASDFITVELQGLADAAFDISLLNSDGRVMRQQTTTAGGSDKITREISLDGLPSGIYLLRVTNGKAVRSSTVVKF